MTAPPVLVTGATGFVGGALVRCLVAAGRTVHVLARPTSDRRSLADVEVSWHRGDVTAPATIAQALAAVGVGADVVHAAAIISYRRADRAQQGRVNTGGTRNVLDACRAVGVGRVVHVGSVVAVGHAQGVDEQLDEDAAFNLGGLGCGYVESKRAAEELALERANELDLVIVDPGAIFGPSRRPSNTTRLLARIARGAIGPFAPPGSLAVVGVDDVATGILLALERGRCGRRYLLTESNWTHRELFRLAAGELGVRAPRWTLPGPAWSAVVAGAHLVDRLRPLQVATPRALAHLGLHYRFDSSRAREELGWRPRPFPEVLAQTVRWMRSAGHLERS